MTAWRDAAPQGLVLGSGQWAELARRYAEPHRAYHDGSHLDALAGWFQRVDEAVGWGDAVAVYLALLYHDAIYEIGAPDNEARSAELLRAHGPPGDLDHAAAIIEATARHGQLSRDDVDPDTALFLDCDTAILGASPERFAAYAAGVAAEYTTVVPEAAYQAGRRHFVETMLASPRIYLTDWFHDRLESRARDNLARARETL